MFNRQSFSRNPADDAKRVASLNDESDWVRVEEKVGSLEAALASPPPPPVPLPDTLAALYRERIAELAAILEDPDHRIEARDRLRPLIERVAVRFSAAGTGGVEIELEGDLVALLSLGLSPNAAKAGAAEAAGLRERVRSVMVVAGGRNQRFLRSVEAEIPQIAA
nr:hypothetical protein [Azospirillum sp. 412522]